MTEDDLTYYERRAREEAEAAASATSLEAASAHRFLATEYEGQVRDLRSGVGTKKHVAPVEGKSQPQGADSARRPRLSIR